MPISGEVLVGGGRRTLNAEADDAEGTETRSSMYSNDDVLIARMPIQVFSWWTREPWISNNLLLKISFCTDYCRQTKTRKLHQCSSQHFLPERFG